MTDNEEPSYYAIIPASVRYSNISANAKLLYGEITALANKTGVCFASNSYFAELYKVTKVTISNWIKELIENNFITSEIVRNENKQILHRYIRITGVGIKENFNTPIKENFNTPIKENFKDNNTSINNTSINNTNNNNIYPDKKRRAKFIPPTKEEIKEYCWLKRYDNVDVNHFYDYYEALDWHYRDGKKMASWKQAIVTWAHNNYQNNGNNKPKIGIDGVPREWKLF